MYRQRKSSRPQPNFAAWYKEWNYGALADGATYIRLSGYHVRHRPTILLLVFSALRHGRPSQQILLVTWWFFSPISYVYMPHWLCYGRPIGQTIIFCSRGSYISSFFFFLAYSQPSHTGCLPYFHTWCGLSANLECMSEMCCMRLAEIQDAKITQKIAICAPWTVNVGPLTAEINWRVWGTPANFSRFRVLTSSFFVIRSTAFSTGRHVHSAGRPSHWASAHILVRLCSG